MSEEAITDTNTVTTETTPSQVGVTITPSMADKIQVDEFERMQKLQSGDAVVPAEVDPNAKPSEDKPRSADGKFVATKKDAEPSVVEEKTEAKTEATVKKPVAESSKSTVSESSTPLFDIDAIMKEVDAEVGEMEFNDVGDTKTTGKKSFEEYGQISEPLMKRQDLAIRRLASRMEELVRPAMAVAQAREAEKHQSNVDATIAAVVDAGVPDAAELLSDPRLIEWADAHPQYDGILTPDPSKADDIAWVFEKFRASAGIAKPSAAPQKRGAASAPAAQTSRSRLVQAGISTARGSGSRDESGQSSGTPEQVMRAEFDRMAKRQTEAERMAGVL